MSTLSQRIAALQAERGHLVANFEAALQPSLTENRDLNDTENLALDDVRERITGVDGQLERLTAAEALLARQAHPVTHTIPDARPGTALAVIPPRQPVTGRDMTRLDDYKGAGFTRMAIAMCVAGRHGAAEYASWRWGDEQLTEVIRYAAWNGWVTRAPNTPPMASNEGPANAGALVRLEHLGAEFIEMLRPMLIVARMPGMRQLQFNNAGTLLIPRQQGGVAGGYVGEGGSIRVQRLDFAQLQLTPSKLAVIVPTTNELLTRSDPGIEQMIRDDMTAGTARTIDTVWFSVAAAGAGPAGILIGRGPLGGVVAGAGSGYIPVHDDDAAVPAVTVALRNMIYELRRMNVPMRAPVWVMNARTKEYLRLLRTNQQIFAFKAEVDAGTLLGYPIIDSTNIPIPWPGPPPAATPNTAYALMDASQLIWAEDMLPMIDASEHASIESDANPATPPDATNNFFSAFQNDMVFMRIRMRHTWARRHDVAVVFAYTAE